MRMNASERIAMHDVQSRPDGCHLRIDAVGVKGMREPVTSHTSEGLVPTVATFSMTVSLAEAERGTHLSRFVELLGVQAGALDQKRFEAMVVDRLDTERAYETKFVGDLVRDVALSLNPDRRVPTYLSETEDPESVHNHSALTRTSSTHRPTRHGQR
jgi:GTP cyclohydrolase FolE2